MPPTTQTISGPTITASALPVGTIMVGGYGDAGTCRYLSANGAVLYPQPASAPVPGTGLSAFCRLSTGDIAQVGGNAPNFPTTGAGVWKASDLTKLSEYTGTREDGTCCAADANGYWYMLRTSAASATVRSITRLNSASAEVATWEITIPAGFNPGRSAAMAISRDGLTAYCWLHTAFPDPDQTKYRLHKFDLTGAGTYVGQLTTDYGSPPGFGSLLVVPDGSEDLLVAFNNLNGATVGPVKRYTPGGSVVWTSGAPAGGGAIDWEGLALGLPGDTHFLAWCYDTAAPTSSGARYVWFNYATGVPDNTRNFTPADGSFEFDSHFAVLATTVAGNVVGTQLWPATVIGAPTAPPPPTLPTPIVPTSQPCCQRTSETEAQHQPTTVQAGKIPLPGSPVWVRSCVGGGLVPSAGDLTDSEAWDF